VKAYKENGRLVLEVTDNGCGMPPEIVESIESGQFNGDGQSLGLQNIFQRLQSDYQSRFSADVYSTPNGGTSIRLNIVTPIQ
jgi:two-component system sensor histidine kinase YesM